MASTPPSFRPLTGIYEPSGILQLPDGRLLVIEDESQHPLSLVTIHPDEHITCTPLDTRIKDSHQNFRKLDDLEGLTCDQAGWLYAITSHSRDGDGHQKKARNKLVRFRIEDDRIVDPCVVRGLKPALLDAHPHLKSASKIRNVKDDEGLNIEALEISADQQHLLIGFRSPLLDNRAIIARVDNHVAMFAHQATPHVSDALITLNLGGHGIRGLTYLPALHRYLIISGPTSGGPAQFQLWAWDGNPDRTPRRAHIEGLPGLEHAEGLCPALIHGRLCIIIVSDDGNRKSKQAAGYVLLDPALLHTD